MRAVRKGGGGKSFRKVQGRKCRMLLENWIATIVKMRTATANFYRKLNTDFRCYSKCFYMF